MGHLDDLAPAQYHANGDQSRRLFRGPWTQRRNFNGHGFATAESRRASLAPPRFSLHPDGGAARQLQTSVHSDVTWPTDGSRMKDGGSLAF